MIISAELTATPSEQKTDITLESIGYIINDGNADIFVGDSPTNVDFGVISNHDIKSFLRIKPGEIISNLDIPIKSIYYRSESGSQKFRIGGISR